MRYNLAQYNIIQTKGTHHKENPLALPCGEGPPGCEGSSAFLFPVSHSCVLSSQDSQARFQDLLSRFMGSWNCCFEAQRSTFYLPPNRVQDLWLPQGGHKKSSKVMKMCLNATQHNKNGPWKYKKTNFCGIVFLQQGSHQMLGFWSPRPPDSYSKPVRKRALKTSMNKYTFVVIT